MTDLYRLLARLAALDDSGMAEPWTWPGRAGGELGRRYAHWHCFQLEASAVAAAPTAESTAGRLLDLAQSAWGDLRGLVAGLDDRLLDAEAAVDGDWTVRAALAHVLVVERRYARQTAYAAARSDADPAYLQLTFALPPEDEAGGFADWVARIEAERAATDRVLRGLPESALDRPTRWADYDVDVRFRLERFAAHLVEHTIHIERLLRGLDAPPGEARQIVRRLAALRGLHERRTPLAELADLDAQQAALAGTLAGSV